MSDDLAAEIAEHQSSECDGHESYCLRCEEPWPCLVRRLADRAALKTIRRLVDAALEQPTPEREG